MNFYSFESIKAAGNCVTFAEQVLGLELDRNGRCPATWRGGDGQNVAIKEHEWFDHKTKQGGGIIELCMVSKFPDDIQSAQNFLGEWLGLEPTRRLTKQPGHCRYDELIEQGFKEVKRYPYEDLDGKLIHFVCRLEHAHRGKEFVQGTPKGWGLKNVTPILYRMRDWVDASYVCIVEGEKDADTLNDIDVPATTNCGGAEKWRHEYAEFFKDKNVVIIRDNDESGERHAARVAQSLKSAAQRIIVICPSNLPKGDVTDWIEKEQGSKERLLEMMREAEPLDLSSVKAIDPVADAAKAANKTDLSNFTTHNEQVGSSIKAVRSPRQINAIIEDIHKRFCGFPRRVGGSNAMFDHDRDSGEIVRLHDASELFAWIGRKSKRRVAWAIGDAMVTKGEIYKGLLAEAITYEAVSSVPDWPVRKDVYYAHPPLPDPSPGYTFFEDLVNYFEVSNDAYRTMLKAFICAPLWYRRGIPRPGWIIDSDGGAGVGKTTLVELVARLYDSTPIRTTKHELKFDQDRLKKRMLSTAGRRSRILLADNITGNFSSSDLSDFMTQEAVSGMAAYGRGEETRPNNLTYVITANSATVDNDLSDRCFFIMLKKPKRRGNWKGDVLGYIDEHRLNIIADIIGMLEDREPMELDPQTRFPEFEETILRGVCTDEAEYTRALAILDESRAASNIEEENAKAIEDDFSERLIEAGRRPGSEFIFIRSDLAKMWLDDMDLFDRETSPMQYLRNLAKNGLASRFDPKPERYPNNGKLRRRGIMWKPLTHDGGAVRIMGLRGRKPSEFMEE